MKANESRDLWDCLFELAVILLIAGCMAGVILLYYLVFGYKGL